MIYGIKLTQSEGWISIFKRKKIFIKIRLVKITLNNSAHMVTAKKIIYISTGDDLGNNDFSLKNIYISLIIIQLMYFIYGVYNVYNFLTSIIFNSIGFCELI